MKKTVNLLDGKYTITFDESTGAMKFLRYNEEWPAGDELRHTNVVAALVQRVIELEEKAVGQVIGEPCFFNLNGKPGSPDMEEDFGRLLVKVRTALDFVVNGPVSGMELPQDQIDRKFDNLVIKLIPEIDVMLQSRVMVKHPFWELAELFSKGGMPEGMGGAGRFIHACSKLEQTASETGRLIPNQQAAEVMDGLAYMATYMQVIMNLYGWRWDDVKLKARQQMAKSGA